MGSLHSPLRTEAKPEAIPKYAQSCKIGQSGSWPPIETNVQESNSVQRSVFQLEHNPEEGYFYLQDCQPNKRRVDDIFKEEKSIHLPSHTKTRAPWKDSAWRKRAPGWNQWRTCTATNCHSDIVYCYALLSPGHKSHMQRISVTSKSVQV